MAFLLAKRDSIQRSTCIEAALDPSWDVLVEATAGGDLAQTTRWAAARKRLGFRCLQLMVRDTGGRTLIGGCLIYAKRLGPAVWAGFIPRGPLLFTDCHIAASAMVEEIVALARAHNIRFLVLQPPEGGEAVDDVAAAAGFRLGVPSVAPESTLRLDLRQCDEDLLARMRGDRRKGIRRAQKAGFDVYEDRDVAAFHRLHTISANRRGFNPISLENLQAQYNVLAPDGWCTIFMVRHAGVPVAGFWVTRFAGTVTTKLSGWNTDVAVPPFANEALEWATIRWARAQGAHSYDLGGFDRRYAELILAGEPLPNDFLHSHSYFKAGYGGTPVLFPPARFVFTQRLADLALGAAAQSIFTTPKALSFIQRLRNG